MAGADLTTYDAALKELYPNFEIEDQVARANELYGIIKKVKDFGGKRIIYPLRYANPQGRSATFASAQNGAGTSMVDVILPRSLDYATALIDGTLMRAAKKDIHAFLDPAQVEVDGAIETLTKSIGVKLFGDGSGVIGRVASMSVVSSTTVITLVKLSDAKNFDVGQVLNFAATKTGTLKNPGSSTVATVSAVNYNAGTVTVSRDITSGGGTVVANNDYIFSVGDQSLAFYGLDSWLPTSDPASNDSYLGVNRSVHPAALSGHRIDFANYTTLMDALLAMVYRISQWKGTPDTVVMSYELCEQLQRELAGKTNWQKGTTAAKDSTSILYQTIEVLGPKGPLKIVCDSNCPTDRFYVLRLEDLELHTLDETIHVIEEDGLWFSRHPTLDAFEVRMQFAGGLLFKKLIHSGVVYNINLV